MAKLIFLLDGAFLGEHQLDKERMTIGRRTSNDIHIDNLAVSGEHASIMTIGNDSFLEDLGSTNGTLVNGKPIVKHVLQHGDLIEFGKYQLKYINESASGSGAMQQDDFEKTMILRTPIKSILSPTPATVSRSFNPTPAQLNLPSSIGASVDVSSPTSAERPVPPAAPVGRLQLLNGANMGKELVLTKALTTLGKTGVQVAVITKRPQGYFITHVEGANYPLVNGVSIGVQASALHDHDVVELAGIKMEFYLSVS